MTHTDYFSLQRKTLVYSFNFSAYRPTLIKRLRLVVKPEKTMVCEMKVLHFNEVVNYLFNALFRSTKVKKIGSSLNAQTQIKYKHIIFSVDDYFKLIDHLLTDIMVDGDTYYNLALFVLMKVYNDGCNSRWLYSDNHHIAVFIGGILTKHKDHLLKLFHRVNMCDDSFLLVNGALPYVYVPRYIWLNQLANIELIETCKTLLQCQQFD